MTDTLAIGERQLPVIEDEESDAVFFTETQDATDDVRDDELTLILQQPIYAEADDYALTGDAAENDMDESTDDTPLAILPDDEYDSLLSEHDGILLDELMAV